MLLKEKCPNCGEQLHLDKACCKKREAGVLLIKHCLDCGYEENWLYGG